jgi:hypothetical protein
MWDIDQIIQRLREFDPQITFDQLTVTHPADDVGLWFLSREQKPVYLQIESSTGNCPFVIEFDTSPTSSGRRDVATVDEAVEVMKSLIQELSHSPGS